VKPTVYVPDALWEAASTLYPTDGASALVQRGLRALVVAEEGSPDYDEIVEALGFAAIFGRDEPAP